jgi:hypothetical protein
VTVCGDDFELEATSTCGWAVERKESPAFGRHLSAPYRHLTADHREYRFEHRRCFSLLNASDMYVASGETCGRFAVEYGPCKLLITFEGLMGSFRAACHNALVSRRWQAGRDQRSSNVPTGTARYSRADHSRTTSPEYKCPSESTLCLSTKDHAPTVATECRQASRSHRQCSTRAFIPALWCQRSNSLNVSAPLHVFCMIPPGHEATKQTL